MTKQLMKLLAFSIALMLVVVGCGSSNNSSSSSPAASTPSSAPASSAPAESTPAANTSPIKIGVIISTTGASASIGTAELNGFQVMVDATNASGGINGRQIELVIADDQTKEAKALSEVKRMIEDKDVMAIVGGASSPISLAMVPTIEETGISYISFGGSSSIIADKKWSFKIPPQERFLVRTLLSDAQAKGIKKIGIIRVNNDYGKSGADTFVNEAPDFGIEITTVEQINPDDKDAKIQISKIMGAGVDALGLWTSTPSESAVVAKGFYELGYAGKYPIYSGPAVSSSEFVKLEPNGSTGVIFPTYKFVVAEQLPTDDPQYEVVNEFLKLYSEKHTERSQFPANGADAWNLLKDAIARAGDDVNRQAIRDNLETTAGVIGQLGTYNMTPTDHNGLDESGFVNVRIDNGQFVLN